MFSNVLSKGFLYCFSLGLLLAAPTLFLLNDTSPILIESLESKTLGGTPVFNKIQFQSKKGEDVWLMEQSHFGVDASKEKWDKIAIKVNKENTAQFMQFENGSEPIHINMMPTNFKISCFFCHSNGPRAIRPNYQSKFAKISLWNKARIQLWNLRIKTYGKLNGMGIGSQKEFRHPNPTANKVLNVKTCQKCHKESGWFARGHLTKQNFMAINFMVENELMPPPGFSLSQEEKEEINQFLKGIH